MRGESWSSEGAGWSYARHTLLCGPGLAFSDAGFKMGRIPTGLLPAINRNILKLR